MVCSKPVSLRVRKCFLLGAVASIAVAQPALAQAVGAPGQEITADYEDYTDVTKHSLLDVIIPPFDPLTFDFTQPISFPAVQVNNLECQQQLDPITVTLEGAGAGAELLGLGAEVVGAIVGGLPESLTVAAQAGGFFARTTAFAITEVADKLGVPDCNAEFLGGVKITGGGISATGNSVIGGSLGVGGNLSVAGNLFVGEIEASEVNSAGAISAYNGLITLGVVDRAGVQNGISIGGGAIGGGGDLGPESFSLHATSIAIGNFSWATSEGSVAYGTNAVSDGAGTVAVGYNSVATAAQAIAVGNIAQALGDNSIAIGNQAKASNGAAVAIGYLNSASGNGAVAIGDPNVATGRGAIAIGADNIATGDAALALGADSSAIGIGAQALGLAASATGNGALAYGNGASAGAEGAIAIGAGASAEFADSIAIGAGAVASGPGQIALGSSNTIITLPSLTSAASRQAQSGPLSIVTTDMFGNLSSDGGSLAVSTLVNRQGVALGIAMQNPDLAGDENSGIAFNWGEFEGAEAYSLSGAIVIARNIFGDGKSGRVALTGSLGISGAVTDDRFRLRVKESVATRIGGQITW